jgi:transposase-like protein
MNEDTIADVIQLRLNVKALLQRRVLEAIEVVLEEEVAQALGVGRHERAEHRKGYRNGSTERRITTANGPQTIKVPRARVGGGDGTTSEFRSEVLPRYQRRSREVNDAILGAYLAGANTRRIRKALQPLLGEENLSKSAISRVVGRLKALFEQWRHRDLSDDRYAVIFLDGFHLKVRLAKRVVSVPVLVAMGVDPEGSKRLIGLELAVSESSTTWGDFVGDLVKRGLRAPALLVTDGHGGLKKARKAWPGVGVQRCTNHKWGNLKSHCPKHAHRDLRRDWNAVIYATSGKAARNAYDAMVRRWSKLCPPVARSLKEAGLELLTFYAFPKPMWKGLRTTNSIENLNREFRRRTKTQGSFSSEEAALTLLFGLVAFRQIELRKITGHQHVAKLMATDEALIREAA